MSITATSATSVASENLLIEQKTDFNTPDRNFLAIKNLAEFIRNPDDSKASSLSMPTELPVFVHANNSRLQIRQVTDEIDQLIRSGVSPHHIGVIARTNGALRPIEAALRSKGIQVSNLSTEASTLHLTNVTWLVHCVELSKMRERTVPAEKIKKKFLQIKADPDGWIEAEKSMSLVKSLSTEGRFIECKQIYLRFFRNHCDRALVEHTLNAWVPLCRGLKSAKELLAEIDGLSSLVPVTTTTIHKASGKKWPYVFLVGATKGLLPLYVAKKRAQKLEERKFLFAAISCAAQQLRIFHAPFKHAKSRTMFESPNPTLMRAAKMGLIHIEPGRRASEMSAAQKTTGDFLNPASAALMTTYPLAPTWQTSIPS